MSWKGTLIVLTPPEELAQARRLGRGLGYLAYRVGQGPHLFRRGSGGLPRGGIMVVDSAGFDGRGQAAPLCGEILRECAARGFAGVLCDFDGPPQGVLLEVAERLGEGLSRRGLSLYLPERYAHRAPWAKVLVPSSLSGGSLALRLEEAAQRWGAQRLVLALERVAQDFFLPAPSGRGTPLTPEQLEGLRRRLQPNLFFSRELCARYFTYTTSDGGAHFVLFDDGDTLCLKLEAARAAGISQAVAALPDAQALLARLPQND